MIRRIAFALSLGLGLALGLLWSLGSQNGVALADPGILYVASGGDCGGATPCYATVQDAVDAATPGEIIQVAQGVYTDVHAREGITQVVYVSKTVTIRGGYTTSAWDTPDPAANPTTLDAQGQGRVIFITGDITSTIEGLRITGGDATGLGGTWWGQSVGGGIYAYGASAVLSSNFVYSNTADEGGGLYLHECNCVTLSSNTITSNTANSSGAGLFLYLFNTEHVALNDNTVSSNKGSDRGGGLYLVVGYDTAVTLGGNLVYENKSTYGGGVCLDNINATLSDNTFYGNTATVAGGGIYNTSGSLEVSNCTIISNTALALDSGGGGGGIYNMGGSLVISNCVVVSNTTLAVGIWGGGGGINNGYGSLAVHNSVIRHNSAVDSGGGIYSSGGALTIFDSVISDNAAQDDDAYGGGVFSSSPAVLTNVTVSGNIVKANSGGIHSQHAMTLTNVTISGNTAGSGGGVLHTNIYTMTIINATITDNKVTGSGHGIAGGVQAYGPAVFLNTIVADNENANCCGSTLNLISQGHNLEDENTCNFSAGTDLVDTDPLLRPLRDNGGPAVGQGQALLTHALSAGSPAIDSGANAGCPATDQRGVARPVDGDLDGVATCDIGAYEFRQWYIYLPLVLSEET